MTRARQAYAAQDWATAASHFDAVAADRLTADDLAAHADAVWWLGRIEDNLRLNAAACDAFLADSRPVEAARAAMVLGIFHLARGDEPQGMGWIGFYERWAGCVPAMLRFLQQDASYEGPRSTDLEALGMVTAPVLLPCGEQTALGTWFVDATRHIAQHVSDPHVRELPGAGHFAPVLAPELIANELIRFFESVRQPA